MLKEGTERDISLSLREDFLLYFAPAKTETKRTAYIWRDGKVTKEEAMEDKGKGGYRNIWRERIYDKSKEQCLKVSVADRLKVYSE